MSLAAAVRQSAAQLKLLHDERLRELAYSARMQKLDKQMEKAAELPAGRACNKPKSTQRPKAHQKPGDGVTAAEREELALQRLPAFADVSLAALLREYCAAPCGAERLRIRVLAARLYVTDVEDITLLQFQAEVSRIAAGLALSAADENNLFSAFTKAATDRARSL